MLAAFESHSFRNGSIGVFVGMLFPLAGMLQASIMLWGDLTLATLIASQQRVPLLWILNAVPFVLGAMLWLTGRQRERYEEVVRDHETRDRELAAELRARVAEVEEALKAKDAMLSVVSHELRTPLTIVLGYAEIIEEEASGMALESATAIREEGKRLLETVNALLDLARLQVGEVQLTLRPVLVADAVSEVMASLRPLVERKGLRFAFGNRAPAVLARLDGTALRRVLTNLIGNAVKFTEQGVVTVTVEHDHRQVLLRVSDTGRGISREFLPKLFEPFTQEANYLDRDQEGTGLGLAIVQRLVHMMHGVIHVESEVGVGTTFLIHFPVYYDDGMSEVVEQPIGQGFDLSAEVV
ncbi:MAG: HAMP domain-containing sensor histidine kinase [Bacteroidota bacterium]